MTGQFSLMLSASTGGDMSRVFRSFTFALALGAIAAPGAATAQQEERAVYASVLDKSDVPVTSLNARDFVVKEDGVSREVLRVSSAQKPMHIAVLVDTSQAIRPYVNDLRQALRSFFREMQSSNEIAVYEFGDRPTRLVDFTQDPALLEDAVGRVFARSGSGAYLLDAIVEVSRDFRIRERDRPVIVVITTQGPEFSNRYHESVVKDLRSTDVILHALVLDRPRATLLSTAARERELTLSQGTEQTGGRRDDLLTSMALKDRLSSLAAELKTQYRVVYARPSSLIAPTRLSVDVQQPRLNVHASQVPPRLRSLQ
jgi:VWFA-related protein